MSKTRYYVVRATPTVEGFVPKETIYLIEAASAPAARIHVANKFISAALIADAKEVAEIMGTGVKPEAAAVA